MLTNWEREIEWTPVMQRVWEMYGGDVRRIERIYRMVYGATGNPTTADWKHAGDCKDVLQWIDVHGEPEVA